MLTFRRGFVAVTSLAILAVVAGACGGSTVDDGQGDASTGNDASTGTDTGTTNPDGSTGVDGGVIGTDSGTTTGGTITCGKATCNADTEFCCATQQGTTCVAKGGQCQGAQLDCSSAKSCPNGEVCCGAFQNQKITATCQQACKGGYQNPQLCEDSSECTPPDTCRPAFGGLMVCAPSFDGGFPPPKDAGPG